MNGGYATFHKQEYILKCLYIDQRNIIISLMFQHALKEFVKFKCSKCVAIIQL